MTKVTAGERIAAKWYGCRVKELRTRPGPMALVAALDREFARRDAKVAEDVLGAFEKSPGVAGSAYQAIATVVRAKYGARPSRGEVGNE